MPHIKTTKRQVFNPFPLTPPAATPFFPPRPCYLSNRRPHACHATNRNPSPPSPKRDSPPIVLTPPTPLGLAPLRVRPACPATPSSTASPARTSAPPASKRPLHPRPESHYALVEGFRRVVHESNVFSLMLRYQAQAERLYRRAVEDFEHLKTLRPRITKRTHCPRRSRRKTGTCHPRRPQHDYPGRLRAVFLPARKPAAGQSPGHRPESSVRINRNAPPCSPAQAAAPPWKLRKASPSSVYELKMV
jgi:hypothetical protein